MRLQVYRFGLVADGRGFPLARGHFGPAQRVDGFRVITRHLAAYSVEYLVAYAAWPPRAGIQAPKIVSIGLFTPEGPRFKTCV